MVGKKCESKCMDKNIIVVSWQHFKNIVFINDFCLGVFFFLSIVVLVCEKNWPIYQISQYQIRLWLHVNIYSICHRQINPEAQIVAVST